MKTLIFDDANLTDVENEMLAAMIASPLMKPFPYKEMCEGIIEVKPMNSMHIIHYWKTQLKDNNV